MLVNQPAILPGAFAAEGDKNTIPANNDGLSGLASIAKGFPPITQQPLAQGGLPPQRQDFNGIFNLFSQFLLYAQNGGVYAYNNSLDYQPPAIIASDNVFYQCVAENGPSTSAGVQPVTNSTYWAKLVPDIAIMKGASASAAGASGLVPAPNVGENDEFLRGDGTWHPVVQSVNGVTPTGGNVDIPKPVIASESEAKAGTNNTKYMTPLRVAQAIDALATSNWTLSKGTNGWARDNTTGFTIQWGEVSDISSSTSPQTITFPRTFTTLYTVINVPNHKGVDIDGYYFYVTSQSRSNFVVKYTENRKWVAYGVS